ncbi:hypothetical protein HMPREF0078_0637 [Anaerococcus vaginalis ATCC 51170]|uniref:Uncharacterized protein n=1 Tax=Anaerococcus vaginalis ATCC 51170 TaxID=655811 RepID=C7HTN6_9FIRM|nr:hypothetical protein HMPREF0078_0637 [Anaerococcus vaginalis ATCC 51170]
MDIYPDEDGNDCKVWMFYIRPIPDNDVKDLPCLSLRIYKIIRRTERM